MDFSSCWIFCCCLREEGFFKRVRGKRCSRYGMLGHPGYVRSCEALNKLQLLQAVHPSYLGDFTVHQPESSRGPLERQEEYVENPSHIRERK